MTVDTHSAHSPLPTFGASSRAALPNDIAGGRTLGRSVFSGGRRQYVKSDVPGPVLGRDPEVYWASARVSPVTPTTSPQGQPSRSSPSRQNAVFGSLQLCAEGQFHALGQSA